MKKYIIALFMMSISIFSFAECYSEGTRVGNLQKFSQKGLINKSWEGEIVMEGTKIISNGGQMKGGNVWAFSVLDPEVAKILDALSETGGSVQIKYCQLGPVDSFANYKTDTAYRVVKAVPHIPK